MTSEELREVIDFEEALSVGDTVQVFWTNSYRYFEAAALIHKVNRKSFIVELLEFSRRGTMFYPAGQLIRVPRIHALNLWSENNCVRRMPRL